MKKRLLLPFTLACLILSACAGGEAIIGGDDAEYSAATESVVTDINVSPATVNMKVGDTQTVTAFVNTKDGAPTPEITWVCDDTSSNVLLLTPAGGTCVVTATGEGSAYISIISGGKVASVLITVSNTGQSSTILVNSISLDRVSETIFAGEELLLNATVNATGGTPNLSWTTNNSEILTVEKTGTNTAKVKGVSEGEATVTVAAGGKTANCYVTVQNSGGDTLSVRLDSASLMIKEGQSSTLTARYTPSDATLTWSSSDQSVASVLNGVVTGVKAGTATISARVSKGEQIQFANCAVTVTADESGSSDYENKIAAWSQPGHLYLHYLRKSDNNYDKWALWMWQSYPKDLSGSLWGASHNHDLKGVIPQTYGYMQKSECGEIGEGDYSDEYGQIIDVDLTREDLVDGKYGKPAPLVSWSDKNWAKFWNDTTLGFLIVDQSMMTGEDMWTSDGGGESFISYLGEMMPEGKNSYLHVYCVEGNVANFTTTSGKQTFVNPTINDETGKYRSQNDITNLKYDAYTNGVSTSSSFLEDKPGVGYQIFVPSFADSDGDGFGDIQGIISKLQYLKELGVEVLWLTPIQKSNSYHGYDVTDYYKIDPKFGSLQDYQELIYKAHQNGMKVLMDMVINHTSKSNVLYKKSQMAVTEEINGKTINYRDMYLWKYKGDKVLMWDEVEGKYDADNPAHFKTVNVEDNPDWYQDGTSNYYYYGKFGSGMAELNYSSQATRDFMTDMCKYWLSFGLDGFRLDAIKHIYLLAELDPNYNTAGDYITYDVGMRTYYNTEMLKYVTVPNDYTYDRDLNVMFWKQFAGAIKSAYPNCFLVGENYDGWDARIAPFYKALDSQFDFQDYYNLNEKKPDAMGSGIQRAISEYSAQRSPFTAINGAFTSNHDLARMMNHAAAHYASVERKYSGGDAIHHAEVDEDNWQSTKDLARYYSAATILTPGVSWIYYGDELGMTGNVNDKVPDSTGTVYDDFGNNVDRWYRQPMKWADNKGEDGVVDYTFGGIEVLWDFINQKVDNASKQQNDPNSLLNYFKSLTAVKNADWYPTYGWVENSGSISGNPYGFYIEYSDGAHTVVVRINASNDTLYPHDTRDIAAGSPGATKDAIPAYGWHVIRVK